MHDECTNYYALHLVECWYWFCIDAVFQTQGMQLEKWQ